MHREYSKLLFTVGLILGTITYIVDTKGVVSEAETNLGEAVPS